MPSAASSQTPSTARKRARCKTTATGSLSLLAVPKLKAGDPVPKADVAKTPGTLHSRTAVTQKPRVLQEPVKHSQTKQAKALTGKENLPARVSSPATVVNHTPGTSASLLRPELQQSGQVKSSANKLQRDELYSKVIPLSASPAKASALSLLPAATTATDANDTYSAGQCGARHAGGAAAMVAATEAAQAASQLHAITAKPIISAAASTSHPTACNAEDQEEQPGQPDVPLACHTAINKRRRPVEQARRYGDWYTGNDTDLDEHLHEYNAEHKHAAAPTEKTLGRRNSALPSYTADMDDSDYAEDDEQKSVRRFNRLRRSTIAPGQDTAAQVAAMTAELSRLADDMLPQEEPAAHDKPGRGYQQNSKEVGKDLRQRLLDSWDGKTYYERLQAEAEDQGTSVVTSAHPGQQQAQQLDVGQQMHIHAVKATPKTARPKQFATGLRPRAASRQAMQQKQKAAAPLPNVKPQANIGRDLQQKQQHQAVDVQSGKASKQAKSTDGKQTQQGSDVLDTSNDASCNVQGYQAVTHSSQQRQRVRTQSRKTEPAAAAAAAAAAVSNTEPSDKGQEPASRASARSSRTAAPPEPPRPHRGHPPAGAGGVQPSESTSTADEGSGPDSALDQAYNAARGGHAGSNNQRQTAVTGAEKGSSAGQQQVARLTAANTALLSELVDMQGTAAVLEEELRAEHSACLAADQEKARLAGQLAEEKEARGAAEQQVTLLQQTILELRAQYAHLSSQIQAPTAGIAQDRLQAVKRHAAALAEAAAAMELV